MKRTRRKFSAELKTKVVLEALIERLALTELAKKHEIHPNQITQWKREFLEKAPDVFSKGDKAQKDQHDTAMRPALDSPIRAVLPVKKGVEAEP